MRFNKDTYMTNSDSNENSRRPIIILSIIAALAFISFFAAYFVTQIFGIGFKKDDVYVPGIYSTRELTAIAKDYCENITLVSSEYFEEPESRRVCTFKDEDHDFNFTVKSKLGVQNQLTAFPLYTKKYECNYKAEYYNALKPILETELADKDIKVVDYYPVDKSKESEKGFCFNEKVLITTREDETEDTEFVMSVIENFGLPKCLSYYVIDVYYLDDDKNNINDTADNSNTYNNSNNDIISNSDIILNNDNNLNPDENLNIDNNTNPDENLNIDNNTNDILDIGSLIANNSNGGDSNIKDSSNYIDESNNNIIIDNDNKTTAQSGLAASNNKNLITMGLDDLTLERFGICAMYMPKNANIKGGLSLSSNEYSEIEDFLFYLRCSKGESGQRLDPNTQEQTGFYVCYAYEDWAYMLKEVYNEKHPENVKSMLDEKFDGEYNVYYNPEDDKIYAEAGNVEIWQYYTQVYNVVKDNNKYQITYNVYDSKTNELKDTVYVIIQEADNDYGYKLYYIY